MTMLRINDRTKAALRSLAFWGVLAGAVVALAGRASRSR